MRMPQFEGVKVWIVLGLLPLILILESTPISKISAAADRQNFSDWRREYIMKGLVGSHCEVLINRGYPPGVYSMDRAFSVKMGWMWGAFEMYCDKAADVGWIVIQRRGQFGERENFNKSWDDYARGFGDFNGEFWLGNEWIHKLTNDFGPYELRIELEDWNGEVAWVQYSRFRIMTEDGQYGIYVEGYTGNATDILTSHEYPKFSTYDNDVLQNKCASTYGVGWWYVRPDGCLDANLNGNDNDDEKGESKERIVWNGIGGNGNLKSSKMMIRSLFYRSLSTTKSHSEM